MNCNAPEHQTTYRILCIACATALAVAITVALPQSAYPDNVTPPPVPSAIQVPAGSKAFLVGHAVGTQQYICLPSGPSVAWTLFGPQATLFNDNTKQIITHFLSPNPDEEGMPRATWQHSNDTSAVWARAIASSSDPDIVEDGAIPWLLLEVVGDQQGPTGGTRLTRTAFIQRLNTLGGTAPPNGCSASTDIGMRALVPYEADYFFYKSIRHDDGERE